jgi:hypothetical protein
MSEHARHHDHAAGRLALGALGTLLWGLAACGGGSQAGFVATNPPPRPLAARPAAEVALIASAGDAGEKDPALLPPHVEVGLIEVLGDDEWGAAEQAAMRDALRARAAEHGCDAVVLLGEIDWVYVVENASSTSQRHGYRGVCVVYR